jgi:hypothetical protein
MSSIKTQKKGLALGAIFALVFSIFSVTPAQAAATDGQHIAIRPMAGTTYTGLLTEDFPLYAQMQEGSTSSNWSKLKWEVTKTAGNLDVIVIASSISTAIGDVTDPASSSGDIPYAPGIDTIDVSSTGTDATAVTVQAQFNGAETLAFASVRAYSSSGITSVSGTVTLTIKAYIDNQGGSANGVHDADEWYVTQTVTLLASSAVAATQTATVAPGDTVITYSATLPSALNTSNLDGKYFVALTTSAGATGAIFDVTGASPSTISMFAFTGAHVRTNSGVISYSFVSSAVPQSMTLSYELRYLQSGNPSTNSSGVLLGSATSTLFTGSSDTDTLDAYIVQGSDAVTTVDDNYDLRANKTYTLKIRALDGGVSESAQVVKLAMTTGQSLATGSAMVAFGTQAASTTLPTAYEVTTNTNGEATVTFTTQNFAADALITISASVLNVTDTITAHMRDVNYALTADYSQYLTTPGTAANLTYQVKDQWGEYPAAGETLRLYVTKQAGSGGFYYAATNSTVAVTGGKATFAFTPEPATKTGSASVLVALQKYNSTLASYADTNDTVTVTVNVSSAANAFDGAGLASSYSVSVSYWPDTTSWVVVSGSTANTGSMVVASGAGLIFSDYTGASTGSGTLAVRAGNNGAYSFSVSGELAGTYTMTVTNGSATTTSLIIVDPASYSAGTAITFDTTSIAAGRTKIVTGKVVDMNGNPIDTTGNATIVVTYAGTAGVPVGSMPTETDANGEFQVSVLTTAADTGTFTLTAVYLKDGANTATADKVSAAQAITVGSGDAVASDDTKVNAGSFKGYVAVYAKGYEGKRLSAKIGNDWVVVESLASNFERVVDFTGAGYTIAVRIYIDRVLVDTITVTTK